MLEKCNVDNEFLTLKTLKKMGGAVVLPKCTVTSQAT
jgi:hypothetical protein